MSFEKLNLIEPILSVLKDEGYIKPTPIQELAIPKILEKRDILGCAQTGTGKTAAFALPILQLLCSERDNLRFTRTIKTLILTPTRELAVQIGESFATYGKNIPLRRGVIFGGVPQKRQTDTLDKGIDILVATPGRLLDLMNQRLVDLRHIKIFVLDEADRMLDMGFFNDVKKIISKLPVQKQTLLFSATMPTEIETLADSLLVNPSKIEVNPVSSTVEIIKQSVYFVNKSDKKRLLLHLLKDTSIRSALVFSRTKHGSNRIAEDLNKAGIYAEAIHGNKSQNARQKALSNFKSKHTRVLVATDIAARGIDIDELSHVINFDIPNVPETYVHRIGRTGRAGEAGTAISFCDEEEKSLLKDINKLISKQIDIVIDHPFSMKDEVILDKNDIFNKKNLKIVENVKKKSSNRFNSKPSSKKNFDNDQLSKAKVEKKPGLSKETPVNNKKDPRAKANNKKISIKLNSNNNSNKKSYTFKNKGEYV